MKEVFLHMGQLKTKRVYDPVEAEDGRRVLVDRLWPRGIKKERAQIDGWAKELTPSAELRKLYHAGEMPFEGFAAAYLDELEASAEAKAAAIKIRDDLADGDVTLVYATKNTEQNHVQVLERWLRHDIQRELSLQK